MGLRRRARELAMQMLYQHDVGGQDADDLVSGYLGRAAAEDESKKFARELFEGSQALSAESDVLLSRYLARWSVTRLAAVDRAILRLALYEFLREPGVPSAVTINEAVELAKRYSTDESGRFVNGVLDRIRLDENVDAGKSEASDRAPHGRGARP